MEQNARVKNNFHKQAQEEPSRTEEHSSWVEISKHISRNKRETLKDKKRAKGKSLQSDDADTDHLSTRPREDEAGSVTSQDSLPSTPQIPASIANSLTIRMPKLIVKPAYVGLVASRTFVGSFGHGSAIFRRPVLQGNCFIEFRLKEDTKKDMTCTIPSAARVGVCLVSFDPALPLGCGHSIAYKSADGSIIRQNQKIGKAEPWSIGDVVTVCLKIRPPRRHPLPQKEDEGSFVEFYKNGKLMFSLGQLRQEFYCFGVSLYNYSQMEMLSKPEGVFGMHRSQHYLATLDQKMPYKDLADSKLFKL